MTPSALAFLTFAALVLGALALHARAVPVTPSAGPSAAQLSKLRRWLVRRMEWRLRGVDADSDAPDEIAQRVLVVIVTRWERFTPGEKPNALRRWASGIARNEILEHRRAAAKRRSFEKKASFATLLRVREHNGRDTPGRVLEGRDLLRRLRARLPAERWRTWYALEIEGYTADEMAAREGVARTTIEWRLRLARRDVARVIASMGAGL